MLGDVTAALTVAAILGFAQSQQQDTPSRVEWKLESVLDTGIAGIPVVVRLKCANRTRTPIHFHELVDPYMALVSWRWEANGASPYEVSLFDLHYDLLPGISPPPRIAIKPGEEREWYYTIPTPRSFGTEEKWTLTATVKSLDTSGQTMSIATVFAGRDPKVRVAADALGATLAQAAILESPREHVIARLLRENKMGTVEESSRQGDWAGDLILFSWALAERKDILRAWKRLESAPNEVKCLRNYLLFRPLAKTGGLITDDEARTLVASLTAESPLGRETIERIKGRRR